MNRATESPGALHSKQSIRLQKSIQMHKKQWMTMVSSKTHVIKIDQISMGNFVWDVFPVLFWICVPVFGVLWFSGICS